MALFGLTPRASGVDGRALDTDPRPGGCDLGGPLHDQSVEASGSRVGPPVPPGLDLSPDPQPALAVSKLDYWPGKAGIPPEVGGDAVLVAEAEDSGDDANVDEVVEIHLPAHGQAVYAR